MSAPASDPKSDSKTADGKTSAVIDKAGDCSYPFAIFTLPREENGKPIVFTTVRRLLVGTADEDLGLTADVIAFLRLKEIGTRKTRFGYTTKTYETVQVCFHDDAGRELQIDRIGVYLLATDVIGLNEINKVAKSVILDAGNVQIIGK